ncbi:hypothetical protein EVAR_63368_1 [Eumeta japonica]|uniref:Uncharacterized protein n=1 Tax=Eumeta variegata TaxID=151549 RepID=A0A4C1ZXA7_EUMVA|nr:hypothetical protein EVAR_63368_1 [Eumeta japonica]
MLGRKSCLEALPKTWYCLGNPLNTKLKDVGDYGSAVGQQKLPQQNKAVAAFVNLKSGLAFASSSSHTFDSDSDPTLIFNLSPVLNYSAAFNSDPTRVLDSFPRLTLNSDSATDHRSDLNEAKGKQFFHLLGVAYGNGNSVASSMVFPFLKISDVPKDVFTSKLSSKDPTQKTLLRLVHIFHSTATLLRKAVYTRELCTYGALLPRSELPRPSSPHVIPTFIIVIASYTLSKDGCRQFVSLSMEIKAKHSPARRYAAALSSCRVCFGAVSKSYQMYCA